MSLVREKYFLEPLNYVMLTFQFFFSVIALRSRPLTPLGLSNTEQISSCSAVQDAIFEINTVEVNSQYYISRSRQPRGLRRESEADRMLVCICTSEFYLDTNLFYTLQPFLIHAVVKSGVVFEDGRFLTHFALKVILRIQDSFFWYTTFTI